MTIVNRVLPDNNDLVVWKLDDAGSTFINSSTSTDPAAPGAAANLTLGGAGPIINQIPTIFGLNLTGVYFTGQQNRTYISGANTFQPAYPITLSFWMLLRTWNTTLSQHFVSKQHTTGVWSFGTFMSLNIENQASSGNRNGEWVCNIIGVGANASAQNTSARPIPLHIWCHVGMTYDGTTIRSYLNGNPANTATISGAPRAINYNGGPWFLGGVPAGSSGTEDPVAAYCDVRIANVVRPASYFLNIWEQANMGNSSQSGSNQGIIVTYYKLRAYDLSCNQPTYWVATSPTFNAAPAPACGGSYGPLEIVESWDIISAAT